jgi:hypothetical protein
MRRLVVLLILSALVTAAAVGTTGKTKTVRVDLSKEKVGRESGKFLSVVGNWSIVDDGGKKVLAVDGRQWLRCKSQCMEQISRRHSMASICLTTHWTNRWSEEWVCGPRPTASATLTITR